MNLFGISYIFSFFIFTTDYTDFHRLRMNRNKSVKIRVICGVLLLYKVPSFGGNLVADGIQLFL